VLSKLYQETDLRPTPSTAFVHPETARARGLCEGSEVRLVSASGEARARLRCDGTLPPGRVALAAGPDASSFTEGAAAGRATPALGVVEADLTWRGTRVELREA
jgi:anaerobic selenocysteine-containing dehydrogenase